MTKLIYYKNSNIFIFYFIILSNILSGQVDTIVLQPGSKGKDAPIFYRQGQPLRTNSFNSDHIITGAVTWTYNGVLGITRSFIEFDLDTITEGSNLINANLILYAYPFLYGSGHNPLTRSNASLLQRVTSSWKEDEVNWNNQPSVTTDNQLFIPESDSNNQNYSLDVTLLINDILDKPDSSHGFRLKLIDERVYTQLIFASGDNPDSTRHPKLTLIFERNGPIINDTLGNDTLPNIVNDSPNVSLILPNIITVNGDAYNEVFVPIERQGIRRMHTRIYNRWGKLIFESSDLNINWRPNQEYAGGLYYWTCEYSDVNDKMEQLKGYVQVFK